MMLHWSWVVAGILFGIVLGFRLGRAWGRVRGRLEIWNLVGGKPGRMKLTTNAQAVPSFEPPDYRPAWNAHTLTFAKYTARQRHISETAIVEAGIVASRRSYRIMAEVMEGAGVWLNRGAGVPRQWADTLPSRAVARLRVRVERGEALPYPTGRPPAVSPPR